MNHIPFAIRVAAVPFRLVGYVARALLMWAGADPVATAVFGVVLLGVLLAFATLPPLSRWIGGRVSAYWQQHDAQQDSEQLWREFDQVGHDQFLTDTHDGHTQVMPGVTQLGPTVPLPTLPAHKLQRRTRAHSIRRRFTRRHSTTSSDRRH